MIGYFRYKIARNEIAYDLNWCFCLASINLNELTSHTDMRVLRKFHPVGVFLAYKLRGELIVKYALG